MSIQRAINTVIAAPDYKPPLPQLEDAVWKKVLDWKRNGFSNDCLEWLGDGLMYAAISVELYRQLPNGTPDMFTRIRGPIVSNQTFALLSNKMDLSGSLTLPLWKPLPTSPTSKCFADLFEVLPAEIYLRGGFDVLRHWVGEVFAPLIKAAVVAYQRQRAVAINNKRKWDDDLDNGRLCNKNITPEVNKRPKLNFGYTESSTLRERIFPFVHPLKRLAELKAASSGTIGPTKAPNPVFRDPPAEAVNSATSKPPMSSSAVPTQDTLKTTKKPAYALSEISGNTASSSREIRSAPRIRGARQAKHLVKTPSQSAHAEAWQDALGPASGPRSGGLPETVLASPSRYTSAAPDAPACGPGSSRFDPIIIDDQDEGSGPPAQAPPREVIELLDCDDSEPEVQQVESILVSASGKNSTETPAVL